MTCHTDKNLETSPGV